MPDLKRVTQNRIGYLLLILWLLFIVILGRFAWLQLVRGEELLEMARFEAGDQRVKQTPRGKILDRNGRELAISRIAKSLVLNPSRVKPEEKEQLIEDLASVSGLKPEEVRQDIEGGGYFAYLKRRLEVEEEKALRELIKEKKYECLELHDEVKRYYPNDMLASNILGFIGTDDQGLAGVEWYVDELLKGDQVGYNLISDTRGRPIFDSIFSFAQKKYQGENSKTVTLTIDANMQFIVEQALDKIMVDHKPKNAISIVMDPRSGEILAMASRPSFDPNKFWDFGEEEWRNRAVSFNYEPGSTFKAMVAGMALEEGVVTPNQSFYDPGHIDVSEKRIQNWNGESFGNVTFTDIVKNSINTSFAQIGLWLGGKTMNEYAKKFGFGEATGIELPGEEAGMLFDSEQMLNSDVATMAIGHSIAVTPLQLITAMSAIANDGVLLKPHIISQIANADGSIYQQWEKQEVRRVLNSSVDKTLVELLEQVVATGGGSKAGVKGYRIAGKTGTAQKINEHATGYLEGRYIASFCGFAPVENPQLVVLVIIDDPTAGQFYGGEIAAPVAGDIFSQLFRYLHISPVGNSLVGFDNLKLNAKNNPPPAKKTQAPQGKVLVPDLKGLSIRDVSQKLAELGLGIGVEGNGLAIKQSIPANTPVEPGSTVIVTFKP